MESEKKLKIENQMMHEASANFQFSTFLFQFGLFALQGSEGDAVQFGVH